MLDHHRQSSEIIDNAVLSYVEPYASSACEMVAEVLQYIGDDGIKIKPAEADAMYAGIVIDTATGWRTTGRELRRSRKQRFITAHLRFPCVRPKDLKVLPWLAHRRQMSCWIL